MAVHSGVRGLVSNWNDWDRKRKLLVVLMTPLLSLFSPCFHCLSSAYSIRLHFLEMRN